MKFKMEEDRTGLLQVEGVYRIVRYAADEFTIIQNFGARAIAIISFPSDCRISFDDTYFWLYKPTGLLSLPETLLIRGRFI